MPFTTIEEFKREWYLAHVSHDPNYDRDRISQQWRDTVLTARTWSQIADRTNGNWQAAAINECLPSQL